MAEVISRFASRLPSNCSPMTVMQLAGFPAEVIDFVVSVLCRMAFDFGLWSDGVLPLLFVREEAHRYAAADRNIGFGPTRKAVSRIAKEGRKYGVHPGRLQRRRNGRDHHFPMQHAVHDAPCQRTRPGAVAYRRFPMLRRTCFRSFPRWYPRGAGLRRRGGAADPAALQGSSNSSTAAQRGHDLDRPFDAATTCILSAPCWNAGAEPLQTAMFRNDPLLSMTASATRTATVEAPMLQPSLYFDPDRFSLLSCAANIRVAAPRSTGLARAIPWVIVPHRYRAKSTSGVIPADE